MKKLQRLCMASAFTLLLTTLTFAGDIQTPGRTAPVPPDPSSTTMPGDIHTPGLQNSQALDDSFVEIALDLLQTMLSVF